MTCAQLDRSSVAPRVGRRGSSVAVLAALTCALLAPTSSAQNFLGAAEDCAIVSGHRPSLFSGSSVVGDIATTLGGSQAFPAPILTGAYLYGSGAQPAFAAAAAAYDALGGVQCVASPTTQLGGLVLGPGAYSFDGSTELFGVNLNGVLTLDGMGNPDAVFVIRLAGGLRAEPGASVVLANGAQAGNVFWRVTGMIFCQGQNTLVGTFVTSNGMYAYAGLDLDGRIFALWTDLSSVTVYLVGGTIVVPPMPRLGPVLGPVFDVGPGCGSPAPRLFTTTPVIGQTALVTTTTYRPFAFVMTFLSLCGGSFPYPGTGCPIYVDPPTTMLLDARFTDAYGNGALVLPVPGDAALLDACFTMQAFVWTDDGPLDGGYVTNGLRVDFTGG